MIQFNIAYFYARGPAQRQAAHCHTNHVVLTAADRPMALAPSVGPEPLASELLAIRK